MLLYLLIARSCCWSLTWLLVDIILFIMHVWLCKSTCDMIYGHGSILCLMWMVHAMKNFKFCIFIVTLHILSFTWFAYMESISVLIVSSHLKESLSNKASSYIVGSLTIWFLYEHATFSYHEEKCISLVDEIPY